MGYLGFRKSGVNVMREFQKVLASVAVAATAALALPGLPVEAAATPAHWRIPYEPAGNTVLQEITSSSSSDAWAFGQTYYGPHSRHLRQGLFPLERKALAPGGGRRAWPRSLRNAGPGRR